jgi:hypothetical protein
VDRRAVAAAVVLLVPVVVTLPTMLLHERRHAHHVDALTPPVNWPHDANVPLLAAMAKRIPEDATIAFRGDRPLYVQSGWVRWVAFTLAPRQIVEGENADWIVVVGRKPPASLGTAERFGRAWLVRHG